MHIRLWCTLALVFANCCPYTISIRQPLRLRKSKQFLLLRTTTIDQRACTCSTSFSCSCCETVTLIYSKMRKTLCSNFMYQRNGLNVDISLNTDTLRMMTVTVYRPFRLCTTIPGSLFSSICVNVVELNEFPRSITACIRHEILTKFQEWQINYTCVSISTTLPMVATNASSPSAGMTSMAGTTAMATATTRAAMSMMPMMPMMPMMASTAAPMMTSPAMPMMMMMMRPNGTGGGAPGQMGAMPPPGGSPPAGQMMGAMPAPGGSAAPGQMGAMPPPGGPGAPGQMGAMPPPGGGPPPAMMAPPGKRKKRYTQNWRLRNRWSRIVNDKFGDSPLNLGDSIGRPIVTMFRSPSAMSISNVPILVVSSGGPVADSGNIIIADTATNYNARPSGQGLPIVYENKNQYPSRIPPVVAMSLQGESAINPNGEGTLFMPDDNNNNVFKKNTVGLVFPD